MVVAWWWHGGGMVVACWCIPTIPSHQSEASFSPPCNSNLVQRFLFDNDNKVARNSLCIFILALKSAFMTSRTQETRLPGITRFTGTNTAHYFGIRRHGKATPERKFSNVTTI